MSEVMRDIERLETLSTGELCERYQTLYHQPVRTRHRAYLLRKLAWRMQALVEGDLSERARRRAAELADDADVRVMPPKAAVDARAGGEHVVVKAPTPMDPRLPIPGTALVRKYKGRTVQVVMLADGFEHDGVKHKTITAAAEAITGCHLNGFRFFKLGK